MQKSVTQDIIKNNVIILKKGSAMKKQSRLHNYAPVTLVLTACSIMYFHDNSNPTPACTIPLSAVISACIVTEPSISIYHGVSQDCSFLVSIGDRSFKFRVDAAATATSWATMIMSAKKEQIRDVGENNPLFINNTAGDNSDGTKFWRTTPVGYVENFNAAIDSISSVLPATLTGNKNVRDRNTSGLSRRQIEALLTFETLICLNEMIVLRTATAFFDTLTARPVSNQEGRTVSEECKNISRLLGHSIARWLVGVHTLPIAGSTPITSSVHIPAPPKVSSENSCSSVMFTTSPSKDNLLPVTLKTPSSTCMEINSTETKPLLGPKSQISQMQGQGQGEGLKPSKNLILHYWIESCVLQEFRRHSSKSITDNGILSLRANMLFRSGSNTGLFIACLVRSISSKSGLLYKWLNPALLMISNILEPLNISECNTNKSSFHSSEENVPQGQGMLSHSDDSDLGTFFKDVVACHESRESLDEFDQHESIYYSDDEYESEYNLDLMSLGDIHASRNEDEVCFLKKLKPEGAYFMEDRPRALNMRSHVFVMEEKENKNEIGDNVFSFMNKDNDHDDKINRKFHAGLTRSQSARNADMKELNCTDKDEDSNSPNTNNNQIYDFIDTRTRAKPVGALKANRQFLRRSFNDAIISVNRPGIKDSSSPSLSFLYDKSKEHGERRVRSTIDYGMNMRSNKRRKCLCQDNCTCPTVPGLLRKESSRSGRIEENNQHGNEIKAIQQSCDDIRIQPCVSINSMESAFEMESKICALIVEKMTLHRDDIPISLEILFQSLRNICTRRNISGLDSRDIGCDVYYSCCSALLVNQLIAPALLHPIKWNLACPSSTHKKNLSTSFSASFSASSQSIDMEEFKSFSSYENSQSNPVSRTNSPKGGSLKDHTLDHSIPTLFGDRNNFSGVSPLYGGGGGLIETSGKSSKASVYSPTAVRTHSRSDATHEAIQQSDINTYPMSLRFSKLLVGTNNVTGNSSGNVTAASSRNSSYEFKSPKYVTSSSSSSAASFYKCSGDSLQLSDDKDCRRDSMDTGVSTGSGPGIFVGSGSPKPLRSSLSFKIFRTDTNIHSEDGNDSAMTESDRERGGGGGGGERFKEGNKGRRVEEEKESKSGRNNHKKIVLSETLMHAAISLICIAHILGGEGKSLEALLCIWDDDKVQGNKIFAAARTLTNCVPLTKAFELSETIKNQFAEKSQDVSVNMCGSSPSGFTSVEECSLLDQLSKAMCKVADQSYMTVNSSSDVVDCKESIDAHTKAEEKSQKCNNSNSDSSVSRNIDDRKRLLIDPLRIFYEDVGGARELI